MISVLFHRAVPVLRLGVKGSLFSVLRALRRVFATAPPPCGGAVKVFLPVAFSLFVTAEQLRELAAPAAVLAGCLLYTSPSPRDEQ